jgi:hypothetical protein
VYATEHGINGGWAMAEHEQEWQIFIENREAVIEALRRGECEGILPAARGFLDGFAQFLLEAGILNALEEFPDSRRRRTIPIFFFCHTLIYRPLFHLKRLAPIERTLFRSAYVLRQLGFNALQIEKGFYQNAPEWGPFTVEAIPECFAKSKAADFLENQKLVLKKLVAYCPAQFLEGLWVMDSVHISVARGAHTEALSFKVCVLGVWQDTVVWPLLWAFVPGSENETVVGKKVFAAAESVLGKGFIRHLLIDRGYLDGAWISKLHKQGTRVTIGVKEDMLIFEEMQNQILLADTVWTEVEPPRLHGRTPPQRAVTGFTALQGEWEGCTAPLSGCLIRDAYPHRVLYQGLVTTTEKAEATEILDHNGRRWTLEEVFMTLTRYWRFDDLAPCRQGVAYALIHFALLAYTLLGFHLQETDTAQDAQTWNLAPPPIPMPERELAVYAGLHFALLLPSELLEIILSHMDAWHANRDRLLMALRLCEGHT